MTNKFKSYQVGTYNKDADHGREQALEHYLKVTQGFQSSLPPFVFQEVDGMTVVDESQSCEVGAKARFGEFFMSQVEEDEIVYVQPRVGFAGISLAYLCKKFGKKLTLIMPSSKKVSPHQLLCIELGATPKFIRIAAMPNANKIAAQYAESVGAKFVPLGLAHPDVTAGAVRTIYDNFQGRDNPERLWCVISTGVLCRALQIALPKTEVHAVAVARNISHGELGEALFYSYHKDFHTKSDLIPDSFDCEPSYDSKGWDYAQRFGSPGDYFFSVAGNAPLPTINPESVDSYRDWGDKRDFTEL